VQRHQANQIVHAGVEAAHSFGGAHRPGAAYLVLAAAAHVAHRQLIARHGFGFPGGRAHADGFENGLADVVAIRAASSPSDDQTEHGEAEIGVAVTGARGELEAYAAQRLQHLAWVDVARLGRAVVELAEARQTGGVGEQVPNGNERRVGRRVHHPIELRQVGRCRDVEGELALVAQRECRHGGDHFGDRADAKNRVRSDRLAGGEIASAQGAPPAELAVDDQRRGERRQALVAVGVDDHAVDGGKQLTDEATPRGPRFFVAHRLPCHVAGCSGGGGGARRDRRFGHPRPSVMTSHEAGARTQAESQQAPHGRLVMLTMGRRNVRRRSRAAQCPAHRHSSSEAIG
jgi:hypothetical protein